MGSNCHDEAEALAVGRRILALPRVERRILELLMERIEQGRHEYGPWPPPEAERRDLGREALEEAIDCMAYAGALLLRIHSDEQYPD